MYLELDLGISEEKFRHFHSYHLTCRSYQAIFPSCHLTCGSYHLTRGSCHGYLPPLPPHLRLLRGHLPLLPPHLRLLRGYLRPLPPYLPLLPRVRPFPGADIAPEQQNTGSLELAWSFILDHENAANPFQDRRRFVDMWKRHCALDLDVSETIIAWAEDLAGRGILAKDALHLACAREALCAFFITTDSRSRGVSFGGGGGGKAWSLIGN